MKLLLAIDVHDRHGPMFDEAASWARRLDARLDLVYVNTFSADVPYLRGAVLNQELQRELERVRQQEHGRLLELLDTLPERLRGEVRVVTGTPAPSICELAPDYDAILVATHGRKGLAHLWLGSTAEEIIRRCPVPVIVLRLKAEQEARDGTSVADPIS